MSRKVYSNPSMKKYGIVMVYDMSYILKFLDDWIWFKTSKVRWKYIVY